LRGAPPLEERKIFKGDRENRGEMRKWREIEEKVTNL
jgi:hypothetical protein